MKSIKVITGLIAGFALVAQVYGGFLDIYRDFNVMTLGQGVSGAVSFGGQGDQAMGSIFSNGDIDLDGYSVLMAAGGNNATDAIIANGNVSSEGGTIRGSVRATGNVSLNNVTVHGNINAPSLSTTGSTDIYGSVYTDHGITVNFGDIQTEALTLSKNINDLAKSNSKTIRSSDPNVQRSTVQWSQLTLEGGGDDGVNWYDLTASEFCEFSGIHIANMDERYIINIDGEGNDIHKTNYMDKRNHASSNGESLKFENILFNFYNTKNLEIKSVAGNILAADADVMSSNGQMDGNLISNSFTGTYQFHEGTPFDFDIPNIPPPPGPGPGPGPTVPEPMTITLLGLGLAGLAFKNRKRKK